MGFSLRIATCAIPEIVLALAIFAGTLSGARDAWAGNNHHFVETGATFHSGEENRSLTGATSFHLGFGAEKRKGLIRPTGSVQFEYGSGLAAVGSDQPSFTLFGTAFAGGLHIFPFKEGRFLPFFGALGVLSWQYLKLPAPPTGVESNTDNLSLGYEFSAGVDLRFGSEDGTAIRLRGGLWNVGSTLAGQSGFQLNGWRMSLGFIF